MVIIINNHNGNGIWYMYIHIHLSLSIYIYICIDLSGCMPSLLRLDGDLLVTLPSLEYHFYVVITVLLGLLLITVYILLLL